MTRMVVLLCGPPGAGKTTLARQSGLAVYDADGYRGEAAFRRAIEGLRADPGARAVVIRFAPTSSARRRAAALIGATHVYLVGAGLSRDELRRRVRGRRRADLVGTIGGIDTWYARHDRRDGVQDFPGWPTVLRTPGRTPPPLIEDPARELARRRRDAELYGAAHRRRRQEWAPQVEAGTVPCSRCGELIRPGQRWHLDHDDRDKRKYRGPSHKRCNVVASNQSPGRQASRAPQPPPQPRRVSSW